MVEIINYLGDISEDFVFKSQKYIFKTEISTSEMVLTLIKTMSINLIYFYLSVIKSIINTIIMYLYSLFLYIALVPCMYNNYSVC